MAKFDSNRFDSKKQEWETPESIFNPLNKEFKFTLDVCADNKNNKVDNYFDKEQNALNKDWSKDVCWMNPPYKKVGIWLKKAYEESLKGAIVVCLIPSRTNTNWWHDYCMKGEIRFIRGRPKFKGCKYGLPQPLSIIIFRGQTSIPPTPKESGYP